MHTTLENILPNNVVESLVLPHVDNSLKLIGVGLSAFALLLGGFIGYNFYWVQRWDSWKWVQASQIRTSIHSFLWNRWYMNDNFYRIFVDGTMTLKQLIYDNFEAKILIPLSDNVSKASISSSDVLYRVLEEKVVFGVLHGGIPSFMMGVYQHFKKMQTGLLNINILYVFIFLLALFVGMLLYGGLI